MCWELGEGNKKGNTRDRGRGIRGKSSSHLVHLDRKQSFCHETCRLEWGEKGGLRYYFSTGVIKKPDSPSHFHLPPSAHALLTWESPPLPYAEPGRGHMQSDWLSAKSLAIMHISLGLCKQSRQKQGGGDGMWRQERAGGGEMVGGSAINCNAWGKRERGDLTPSFTRPQFAS